MSQLTSLLLSRRGLLAGTAALAGVVGLAACGADGAADTTKPLRIIADADPHTTLLKQAESLGLLGDVKLELKEISGQVDPNQLVNSGDVDANFFQHIPYLNNWNSEHKADLVNVGAVHIEPLGLYSKKVADLKAVPDKATIAIPADATNQARALFLLSDAGLLTLNVKATDKDLDFAQVTQKNITANPHNLGFVEIDRPQLAATLDDAKVTLSVINGNYALEAGLTPASDAKFLEKAEGNPYVNVVVTTPALKDDPRVKKVVEALTSKQIQDFITSKYKGSVLPAKA